MLTEIEANSTAKIENVPVVTSIFHTWSQNFYYKQEVLQYLPAILPWLHKQHHINSMQRTHCPTQLTLNFANSKSQRWSLYHMFMSDVLDKDIFCIRNVTLLDMILPVAKATKKL